MLLVLGTHNRKKGLELAELLEPYDIQLKTLAELPEAVPAATPGSSGSGAPAAPRSASATTPPADPASPSPATVRYPPGGPISIDLGPHQDKPVKSIEVTCKVEFD